MARVVIIDDSATGRLLMRHLLNASGVFSVIGEAADGWQGIELATREQPDVILLDFAMPAMDGLEALPHLVSAVPGALVIMLSGFEAQDSAGEALSLGAHAYLEKNERPDDLLRRIVDLYQAFAAPATAGETSVDLSAQATHNQFRPSHAHVGAPTAFVDLAGRLLDVNPAFCRLTGHPESDLVGRPLDGLFSPEDRGTGDDLMRQLVAGDIGSYSTVRRYLGPDGTSASLGVHRSLRVDRGSRPPVVVARLSDLTDLHRAEEAMFVAHDELAASEARYWAMVESAGDALGAVDATATITERKAHESRSRTSARQRTQTNSELVPSNGDLSDFAAVAAHDLKSPLHLILGFSELLDRTYRDRLDDHGRDLIASIVAGAEHMEGQIEGLLRYCRLQTAPRSVKPVDLEDLLTGTLAILGPEVERRGAIVTRDALPRIQGDPTQLQELLENLISNALRFSTPGMPPRVHVGAEEVADGWRLSVSDNGIGIDTGERQQIFGMFTRLNPDDAFAGTGIGLALCRRVAERHGGQISVEDNPTGGSRFLVTIPDLGPHAGPQEPARAPSTTPVAPPASPLEVLLVEDSPPHAKLIAALLARAPFPGYRVHHVATLAEALVALTTTEVDCVLLDLSLPDARDLEGVAQVTSAAPLLPVVVITSSTDEAQAFAAVKEGAQDYLVKGHIDVEHLSRSIRWAVQRKALETELAHDALHDALTGLPNRTLMVDRLRSALARTVRSGTKVGVFYLDLDGFKSVNDRLGHDAGDRVLVMVADRMSSAVRPQDTVARVGGDEFVVISEGFSSPQEAEVLRTRLAITLAAPIELDNHTLQVTASIGLAVGDHQATVEGLLREADLAMYQAKHARR